MLPIVKPIIFFFYLQPKPPWASSSFDLTFAHFSFLAPSSFWDSLSILQEIIHSYVDGLENGIQLQPTSQNHIFCRREANQTKKFSRKEAFFTSVTRLEMPMKAMNKREIMVRELSFGSSPEGCLKAEHLQLLQKLSYWKLFVGLICIVI